MHEPHAINKLRQEFITLTESEHGRYIISAASVQLNDMEQRINPDLIRALNQYGIKALLWSRRDEYAKELAA